MPLIAHGNVKSYCKSFSKSKDVFSLNWCIKQHMYDELCSNPSLVYLPILSLSLAFV